jgi:hypothetical protein
LPRKLFSDQSTVTAFILNNLKGWGGNSVVEHLPSNEQGPAFRSWQGKINK